MSHIEGVYEEILEDLEKTTGDFGFHSFHGSFDTDGDSMFHMNVGLFSVNDTHPDNCHFCTHGYNTGTSHVCSFDNTSVMLDVEEYCSDVDIENPESTHLIRF